MGAGGILGCQDIPGGILQAGELRAGPARGEVLALVAPVIDSVAVYTNFHSAFSSIITSSIQIDFATMRSVSPEKTQIQLQKNLHF